jgi:hypothetical protein
MDRPITTEKAQKSSCAVPVESRLVPKLSTITNASGENMMTYLRIPGPIRIVSAAPERANSRATTPVSRTPDAM